jgi:hypothetical protein
MEVIFIRLLYIVRFSVNKKSGVEKKILSQVKSLLALGTESRICSIYSGNEKRSLSEPNDCIAIPTSKKCIGPLGKFEREYMYNKELEKIISKVGFDDVVYMRMPYPSPQLIKILSKPRKCKIVVEHQAIEHLEYKLKGKYWYVLLDALFGDRVRSKFDAVVGVTREITEYQLSRCMGHEIPHITIGNGFDVPSVPIRQPAPFNGGALRLLCVANVNRWHGIDRVIRGLSTYVGDTEISIHVAGVGSELPYIKRMCKELGVAEYVTFHGFVSGKDLDSLFNQCHVAIGSLGIHRVGLKEASTLKAREYCARGIPFIYSIPDADFSRDFPYMFSPSSDEAPIDMDEVIKFTTRVYENTEHPQEMRRYATDHLDWSIKMKKLNDFLSTILNGAGESDTRSSVKTITSSLDIETIDGVR